MSNASFEALFSLETYARKVDISSLLALSSRSKETWPSVRWLASSSSFLTQTPPSAERLLKQLRHAGPMLTQIPPVLGRCLLLWYPVGPSPHRDKRRLSPPQHELPFQQLLSPPTPSATNLTLPPLRKHTGTFGWKTPTGHRVVASPHPLTRSRILDAGKP